MPKSRLGRVGAVLVAAIGIVGGAEGLRTTAYPDPVLGWSTPTICYGETQGVRRGDTYTPAECREMLGERLIEFAEGLERCIVEPDRVPDRSYIAFISWAYNVGIGAACSSTLVKKLNAGDLVGACNELPRWNKSGGRVVQGLVNRRAEEQKLCLEGGSLRDPIVTPVVEAMSRWYWVPMVCIPLVLFIVGAVLNRRENRRKSDKEMG